MYFVVVVGATLYVKPVATGDPVGRHAEAVSMYHLAELKPDVDDRLSVTESPSQIMVEDAEAVIAGFAGTTITVPKAYEQVLSGDVMVNV
jgi:hypothetical protein